MKTISLAQERVCLFLKILQETNTAQLIHELKYLFPLKVLCWNTLV